MIRLSIVCQEWFVFYCGLRQRTRECAGARERERERERERNTHTAAAAVRASDIGAENGCRVLQIHFESALRKSHHVALRRHALRGVTTTAVVACCITSTFISRLGADAAPSRLMCVRQTTLSHHCTRAYDVVLCEGDARAAD